MSAYIKHLLGAGTKLTIIVFIMMFKTSGF